MKTAAEKLEFMEAEGWKYVHELMDHYGNFGWRDKTGLYGLRFKEAFAIASRRRQSRDRARLRKAGIIYNGWWYMHGGVRVSETRQEAIAYLDRMEGK